MSMRSSVVYGEAGGFRWHGWEQLDEDDAFYLDVTGPKDSCGVADDSDEMKTGYGFEVRMPMAVFEHIVREYAESQAKTVAIHKMIEEGMVLWESADGRCAACCKHGPEAEAHFRPTCKRCGGTGKSPATIAEESK